ncbi:hypothetical protein EST54_04910 [Streptomyces sioyaensis]|uniref:Recombination endonuclease VII n=2 Tax=Streptomyces sioyaensis TaxID=67364 RepID=A0A4Q1R8Z1_9ACTN|nr:hypothetical protein EST54_04910 [Streptomyces sioyaensis]
MRERRSAARGVEKLRAAFVPLRSHREKCGGVAGRARRTSTHLTRQYALGEAEREAMIKEQRGMCVICLAADPVHVDHDHETGKVRGVLCFSCNAALGQFKDRPDVLRRAAEYPEGNVWKPTLEASGVYQLPS